MAVLDPKVRFDELLGRLEVEFVVDKGAVRGGTPGHDVLTGVSTDQFWEMKT